MQIHASAFFTDDHLAQAEKDGRDAGQIEAENWIDRHGSMRDADDWQSGNLVVHLPDDLFEIAERLHAARNDDEEAGPIVECDDQCGDFRDEFESAYETLVDAAAAEAWQHARDNDEFFVMSNTGGDDVIVSAHETKDAARDAKDELTPAEGETLWIHHGGMVDAGVIAAFKSHPANAQ